MCYQRLSKEATNELLRYLRLLIDDIQFSQAYREMMEEEQESHQDQQDDVNAG